MTKETHSQKFASWGVINQITLNK